ncbi:hypothetical protein ACEQ8H_006977 [Pleosporales sp. CAS-2024a]
MATPPWKVEELRTRIGIPAIDESDARKIVNTASDIIYSDQGRAQQVMQTRQFRQWIMSPGSAKLLIHGDFDDMANTSPFSVLAATVLQAFRTSPQIISMAFFCGQHLVKNEHYGGIAMICSFIAQLLRQFPSHMIPAPREISINEIGTLDISGLCDFFVYIIGQLPSNMTVFCIIDGIDLYEREEYIDDMGKVVLTFLDLVSHGKMANMKLLLLSPRPMREVRQAFDDEPETLLHMHQLPIMEDIIAPGRIHELTHPWTIAAHAINRKPAFDHEVEAQHQ